MKGKKEVNIKAPTIRQGRDRTVVWQIAFIFLCVQFLLLRYTRDIRFTARMQLYLTLKDSRQRTKTIPPQKLEQLLYIMFYFRQNIESGKTVLYLRFLPSFPPKKQFGKIKL